MSDGPEWFVPKRYGYGATPITWQGWALTIGFVLITIALAALFGRRPIQLFAVLVPLLVVFTVICARTTKGGGGGAGVTTADFAHRHLAPICAPEGS